MPGGQGQGGMYMNLNGDNYPQAPATSVSDPVPPSQVSSALSLCRMCAKVWAACGFFAVASKVIKLACDVAQLHFTRYNCNLQVQIIQQHQD